MIARTPSPIRRRELADVCDRCAAAGASTSPTLPHVIVDDGRGGLCASYRCGRGHRWSTWWDPAEPGSPTPAVTTHTQEPPTP